MICLVCNRPSLDGLTHPGCRTKYAIDGVFCAVSYKKLIKKLIYNFKYKPYLTDLRKTLVELFYESIIQQELFQKAYLLKPILAPIPLHNKKLKSRGYNHSELLAKDLSGYLKINFLDVLLRARKTRSQFGLNLKERKENLKNAFILSSKFSVQGLNMFLVDDILTTGSTLLEAAKVLKRNGARKVWGLVLARD
jgi:competence protein ComFC